MFRCSQIYRPTTDYVSEDIRRESSIRRTSLSLAKNLTGKGERGKKSGAADARPSGDDTTNENECVN